MIKDLKFEYDLDDVRVDTRFHSELRKIMDHYDTCASSEEAEAVRLLIEKINVVNVLNRQPYFDAMALQYDIRMPIASVKDYRFFIQHTINEARKIRIQASNYGYVVSCGSTTRVVDSRHPNKNNSDKQRYYLDSAKSRGRIGSIASQQRLYQLSILCN